MLNRLSFEVIVVWLWAHVTAISNGNLVSWKDVFDKNETLQFGEHEFEELWRWEVDTIAQTLESTHKRDSKVNPMVFFYWRIFAESLAENNDFNSQEGFSMKKMDQICQILENKFYQLPDFH